MKFTLTMEDKGVLIKHEFEATLLDDFYFFEKSFLLGCGYVLEDKDKDED
jgi:hypothetical protein